jgi:hypothetical protein
VTDVLYQRFIGHFTLQQVLDNCAPAALALPRFAIVRNPWDRLVSAYEFARVGGNPSVSGKMGKVGGGGGVRVAQAWKYRGELFDTFEKFVKDFMLRRDPSTLDGIFRPQCYYVRAADGTMPLDFIGRFEHMDATRQWLADTLGRPIDLPQHNASQRSAYHSYYTPELRNLVGDIYADDIAALHYDF